MADADQDQWAPCDEVIASSASHGIAVSQLSPEHNGWLMEDVTARLRSEQEAKEIAQEPLSSSIAVARAWHLELIARLSFKTTTNLAKTRRNARYRRALSNFAAAAPGAINTVD